MYQINIVPREILNEDYSQFFGNCPQNALNGGFKMTAYAKYNITQSS